MESIINELADAGWVRVGPYSPYWKAPDDTGHLGRKYNERAAHAEMVARRTVKTKATPRAKTTTTAGDAPKRGPGRPRKTPVPEPDE